MGEGEGDDRVGNCEGQTMSQMKANLICLLGGLAFILFVLWVFSMARI